MRSQKRNWRTHLQGWAPKSCRWTEKTKIENYGQWWQKYFACFTLLCFFVHSLIFITIIYSYIFMGTMWKFNIQMWQSSQVITVAILLSVFMAMWGLRTWSLQMQCFGRLCTYNWRMTEQPLTSSSHLPPISPRQMHLQKREFPEVSHGTQNP